MLIGEAFEKFSVHDLYIANTINYINKYRVTKLNLFELSIDFMKH